MGPFPPFISCWSINYGQFVLGSQGDRQSRTLFQLGKGVSVGDIQWLGGPQERKGAEDKRPRTRMKNNSLRGPCLATELVKKSQTCLSILTAKQGLMLSLADGQE